MASNPYSVYLTPENGKWRVWVIMIRLVLDSGTALIRQVPRDYHIMPHQNDVKFA